MTRADQCKLKKRTLCAHGKYLHKLENLVVADILLSKLKIFALELLLSTLDSFL